MAAAPPPPPPSGAAGGADVDLQAVEGIPRDTLVALLKRKDKEAKGLAAKLEKLEERYVKVVRFNKILMEDRTSFQRFCSELLPESDGAFEEAAAQETPVNLDALLRRLAAWRGALENAGEERSVFRQFTELVFPGDVAVAQLFEASALGFEALDTLQQRWTAVEDLHNQSIASVNAMAREQMMARTGELEAAIAGRKEAERKNEELMEQLTHFHREKAQQLTQRLSGGGGGGASGSNGGNATPAHPGSDSSKHAASNSLSFGHMPSGGGSGGGGGGQQLRELREALDAAERRELEARAAAARREEELRGTLDSQQAETQRLKRELERIADDGERHRSQARQMLEEKDAVTDRLRARVAELQQELGSNNFIAQLAEKQAGRDADLRAQQRQVDSMNQTVAEIQRLLALSYSQERVLKDRIRELEGSHGRGHVAGDYLKHVVLKYMEYTQVGDLKAQGLVPVLCTLLSLSPEERRAVENPGIPQPLLLINQAVGGATTWLRGAAGAEGNASPGGAAIPQQPPAELLSS
mmetsp:Transcript_5027/g.12277  ORF Transcript_5027/g.12277 Transcript_5027/m.12277 type:complete len:527 (-) Transcript_5027:47-1627(-)